MIVHALRFGNVDLDGLTFVEWMSTQDAGTMDFGVYLDSLRPPEADDDEKARVYEAWEAGMAESLGNMARAKHERVLQRREATMQRMASGATRGVVAVAAPAPKQRAFAGELSMFARSRTDPAAGAAEPVRPQEI